MQEERNARNCIYSSEPSLEIEGSEQKAVSSTMKSTMKMERYLCIHKWRETNCVVLVELSLFAGGSSATSKYPEGITESRVLPVLSTKL